MTPKDNPLTFEEALQALETCVARLEKGDMTLQDAIEVYEQGMTLKKHCEDHLLKAQLRVDKIDLKNPQHLQPFQES